MTRYIDVNDLCYLVSQKGLPTCITEMAEYIRADYLRLQDFEKCARLANHSPDGVIELVPLMFVVPGMLMGSPRRPRSPGQYRLTPACHPGARSCRWIPCPAVVSAW